MDRDKILRLAREAGFRVFGAKVVAADNGSSGDATESVARLIAAVRAETLDEAARVCRDKAMRCEAAAQQAIEHGEHDEVSAIRSTAWQINVCEHEILALKENTNV